MNTEAKGPNEKAMEARISDFGLAWGKVGEKLTMRLCRRLYEPDFETGFENFLKEVSTVILPFSKDHLPPSFDPSKPIDLMVENLAPGFALEAGLVWCVLGNTPFISKSGRSVPLGKMDPSRRVALGVPLSRVDQKAVQQAFGSLCVRLFWGGPELDFERLPGFPMPMKEMARAWVGMQVWNSRWIDQLGFARWAWSRGLLRPGLVWGDWEMVDPASLGVKFEMVEQ